MSSDAVEITNFADVLAAGPPKFGEQNGAVWKARLVTKFEEISGHTLYEGLTLPPGTPSV